MKRCIPPFRKHDWGSWSMREVETHERIKQVASDAVYVSKAAIVFLKMWEERYCEACGLRETRVPDTSLL